MNDPTKDTIPRSAVEYCLRKETVSTNPDKYKTHEKFIDYMNDPDISEFGHWMHSNGFKCALIAISVDLKKNSIRHAVRTARTKDRALEVR